MRPAPASQIPFDAEIRTTRNERRFGTGGEDGDAVVDGRGARKAPRCDRPDPWRRPVESIAKLLARPRLIARNREYVTYTGELGGRAVSVCSTGIGSPSTAIAVEELAAIGATTFIRVGTTGSIQSDVGFGDMVVATAAVRDEGTTPGYAPLGYPAVADFELAQAMLGAARRLNQRVHTGIVRSHDSL